MKANNKVVYVPPVYEEVQHEVTSVDDMNNPLRTSFHTDVRLTDDSHISPKNQATDHISNQGSHHIVHQANHHQSAQTTLLFGIVVYAFITFPPVTMPPARQVILFIDLLQKLRRIRLQVQTRSEVFYLVILAYPFCLLPNVA